MTFWFPKLTLFLGTLGNINWYISKNNKTPKKQKKNLFCGHMCLGKDVYIILF